MSKAAESLEVRSRPPKLDRRRRRPRHNSKHHPRLPAALSMAETIRSINDSTDDLSIFSCLLGSVTAMHYEAWSALSVDTFQPYSMAQWEFRIVG